jgi:hypothetical protein
MASQIRDSQQALDGKRAPAAGNDHERIGRHDIGPPGRQREQLAVLIVEMNPVLTPVKAVSDELEVPAIQRMKPVLHPHPAIPIV